MFQGIDLFRSRRARVALAAVLLLGPGLAAVPAIAQEDRAAAVRIGAEIEERFEVLPTRDGLILRPRAAGSDVLAIEVAGGEVALDGEPADEAEVRRRLGAAAGAVLALAELDPAEARSLFRFGAREVEMPEPPLPPEAADVPPVPGGAPELPPVPGIPVGEKVSFGSSVHIEEGEVAQQIVVIGGSAKVDGQVLGEVVAVGGSVDVRGRVGGEVVAVGGGVELDDAAAVGGDVVAVGGHIRDAGAEVGGQKIEVSMLEVFRGGRDSGLEVDEDDGWFDWGETWDVVSGLIAFGVVLLLVWIFVLVAPRPMERVEAKIADDPWRAALAGLGGLLLFFPLLAVVTVILVVSVIGIPLLVLVPFVVLLAAAGLLLGYAATAVSLGRWLGGRFGWPVANPYRAALIGLVAIQGPMIAGDVIDILGTPFGILAVFLMAVGFVLWVVALIVGFGGFLLTRYGLGPRGARPSAALPPPPMEPPAEEPTPDGSEPEPEERGESDSPRS